MNASWWEDEFWRVRVALVTVSAVAWMLWMAAPSGYLESGEPAMLTLAMVANAAFRSGMVHVGLFLSLVLERGGWARRAFCAVLMIPNCLFAGMGLVYFLTEPAIELPHALVFLSLATLHLAQLWRLTGMPFPRISLTALSSIDNHPFSNPNAAPGITAAERNARR